MPNATRILPVLLALLGCALPAQAADPYDGQWHYTLTPYIWGPSASGTLRVEIPETGAVAETDVPKESWLNRLRFAFMIAGEARRNELAIFGDFAYVNFGHINSNFRTLTGPGGIVQVPTDTGSQTTLKASVATLAASYTVMRSSSGTLDVLGGVRYTGVRGTLDWQVATDSNLLPGRTGSATKDVDLWDGIIGVRGRGELGGNWYLPYYVDIGTGDSQFTWQAMGGVGYRFPWGDVIGAWRYLSYDQRADKPIQDLHLSGPAIGVAFRF
jgi:hypothetical protein